MKQTVKYIYPLPGLPVVLLYQARVKERMKKGERINLMKQKQLRNRIGRDAPTATSAECGMKTRIERAEDNEKF